MLDSLINGDATASEYDGGLGARHSYHQAEIKYYNDQISML
jgi:hypothetical protein